MIRRTLVGLTIGLAAAIAGALLAAALPAFEDLTYDWRLTATPPRPDIALVMIDESSLRALAPVFGRWPWPRVVHSGVIDFLARAHARVIAYDILFTERDTRAAFPLGGGTMTGADSDAALVESVRRGGNVILLADATFEGDPTKALPPPPILPGVTYVPGAGFQPKPWLTLPFPELAAASAGVGHDGFITDPAGNVVRRMLPFVDARGVAVPVLGFAAALAANRTEPRDVKVDGDVLHVGPDRMPLDRASVTAETGDPPVHTTEPSAQAFVAFRGGAGTYPTYPFFNLLKSEDQIESGRAPLVDPAAFKDKIVFVGTSAAGLFDQHVTPFGAVPGAAIHAAIADDVLSDRFVTRATAREDVGVVLVTGLVTGVVAVALPVVWASVASVGVAAVLTTVLTHEARAGLWIGLVGPIFAVAIALFGGVAWQYFVEGREKRKIRHLFGRYVSKDVFHSLLADPSRATLGGERRDMSVLFSDIRGFTTRSEASPPEEVVAQLNEYFSEMVTILFRHHGTLDKFVGDMVMGLFGAPVEDPAHADHAVAAAIEMVEGLERLNARWRAGGGPPLDIGIGINSGEMIAGNIGSDTIMSYTVIGDAVNLAARLESLNKDYGTRILLGQGTIDRLRRPVATRRIGDVTVKGKTQGVTVHEVIVNRPDRT